MPLGGIHALIYLDRPDNSYYGSEDAITGHVLLRHLVEGHEYALPLPLSSPARLGVLLRGQLVTNVNDKMTKHYHLFTRAVHIYRGQVHLQPGHQEAFAFAIAFPDHIDVGGNLEQGEDRSGPSQDEEGDNDNSYPSRLPPSGTTLFIPQRKGDRAFVEIQYTIEPLFELPGPHIYKPTSGPILVSYNPVAPSLPAFEIPNHPTRSSAIKTSVIGAIVSLTLPYAQLDTLPTTTSSSSSSSSRHQLPSSKSQTQRSSLRTKAKAFFSLPPPEQASTSSKERTLRFEVLCTDIPTEIHQGQRLNLGVEVRGWRDSRSRRIVDTGDCHQEKGSAQDAEKHPLEGLAGVPPIRLESLTVKMVQYTTVRFSERGRPAQTASSEPPLPSQNGAVLKTGRDGKKAGKTIPEDYSESRDRAEDTTTQISNITVVQSLPCTLVPTSTGSRTFNPAVPSSMEKIVQTRDTIDAELVPSDFELRLTAGRGSVGTGKGRQEEEQDSAGGGRVVDVKRSYKLRVEMELSMLEGRMRRKVREDVGVVVKRALPLWHHQQWKGDAGWGFDGDKKSKGGREPMESSTGRESWTAERGHSANSWQGEESWDRKAWEGQQWTLDTGRYESRDGQQDTSRGPWTGEQQPTSQDSFYHDPLADPTLLRATATSDEDGTQHRGTTTTTIQPAPQTRGSRRTSPDRTRLPSYQDVMNEK